MRGGKLRMVLVIEQPVETRGAAGGVVTNWSTFATVRGRMLTPRPREVFAAQQVQSQLGVIFEIRWLPGVTSKMRVKHQNIEGAHYYAIEGPPINVDDRNHTLMLNCMERESDGWR